MESQSAVEAGRAWDQPLEETGGPAINDRFTMSERFCIIYTLKCNIACAHCMTASSPKRKEKLTPEEAIEVMRVAAARGKKHLTFSGGEIFLYYDELLRMTAAGTELGLEVDVGTNAFWGHTEEKARQRLEPLKQAGLKGLCFSVDAHHAAFFPPDRVVNAYRAATELGLLVEVNFCPSADHAADEAILGQLTAEGVPFLTHRLLNRGYAREGLVVFPKYRPEQLPDCGSQNLTVHPLGEAFVCCELEDDNAALRRTPAYLGSLRDGVATMLGNDAHMEIMRALYDPESPAYFRKLLATEESFGELRSKRFHSICDFCVTAMSDPARVAAAGRAALVQIEPSRLGGEGT